MTCISNAYQPTLVTVSGYVAADSSFDPGYVGFYLDSQDYGDVLDGFEVYLMNRVPSPDECGSLQGFPPSSFVTEGGLVVYPAKR